MELNKVDRLVKTMMLAYPTLYPNRAAAIFGIFHDSGTNYRWNRKGEVVPTYPEDYAARIKKGLDLSDLDESDKQWTRDDEFSHHVRLENELKRIQRRFVFENIDSFAKIGRSGDVYGHRHISDYIWDGWGQQYGCPVLYRAPWGKIDPEWARAMESFIHHMVVAYNRVYRLHFDHDPQRTQRPEPTMFSLMPAEQQRKHGHLMEVSKRLEEQTGSNAKAKAFWEEHGKKLMGEIDEETQD